MQYVPITINIVSSNPAQTRNTRCKHYVIKCVSNLRQGSSELYGDLLVHVSEPLSALFRKAHSLQVAFLNLLDKLTVEGSATDKDVQDICLVCYGLFEVCQIVTSLDVKLVVTLWKAISKHAVHKKELLKHHLNVDEMVRHLCTEIKNGYSYLFQLLPHVDEDGIVLSQGDEKGFQKSVKILGFQMKITVSLVREYQDYLSDCGSDVYNVLIHLQRMMPSSIHGQPIEDHHGDEIRRQLLNATEPLVNSLLTNTKFLQSLTNHGSVDQLTNEDSLPHLLLTIMAMDSVPKLSDDEKQKWLSPSNYPEELPRYSIIQTLFCVLRKCSLELNLPVYVPGLSNTNRNEKQVCLYDEVCVHFCGMIGSLPAKDFSRLEEVLVENVLSTDLMCSQLVTDAWCFLVRFGTADLCDSHIKVLLEVLKNIPGSTLQYRNLVILVNRMIKFMAKEHQADIMKLYPPSSYMELWSVLSISGFTSTNSRNLVDGITSHCIKVIHNFINTSEKKVNSFVSLNSSLDGLLNIFTDSDVIDKYLPPDVHSTLVDKITKLCNNFSDWTALPITRICFGKVIQLYSFILQHLNNKEILQIIVLISATFTQTNDQYLKLSIAKFLQQLGKIKLSASFEQSQILNKVPEIFNNLLSDSDFVVQHKALEAFTKFAELTIHESVVPQCIQDNQRLQNSVVAFLNKTPFPSTMKRREYLVTMLQNKDNEEEDGGEPSSKRPRTDDTDPCLSMDRQYATAEVISLYTEKRQSLIEALTLCSQGLRENEQNLPNHTIKTLKETRDMISSFLNENG